MLEFLYSIINNIHVIAIIILLSYFYLLFFNGFFRNRAIDGTDVIIEHETKRKENNQEDAPRRGPEPPFIGHHDTISQLTVVKGSQGLMVSGAQDGVIKVWV